jgi:hypothetical protein
MPSARDALRSVTWGPSRVVDTEVYADHMQFCVVDPEAEYRPDFVWDGRGLERHLGVSDGIVAVGTVLCLPSGRVELWTAEPTADVDDWDHVWSTRVSSSARVSSGSRAWGLERARADGRRPRVRIECARRPPGSPTPTRWKAATAVGSRSGERRPPSQWSFVGGLRGTRPPCRRAAQRPEGASSSARSRTRPASG